MIWTWHSYAAQFIITILLSFVSLRQILLSSCTYVYDTSQWCIVWAYDLRMYAFEDDALPTPVPCHLILIYSIQKRDRRSLPESIQLEDGFMTLLFGGTLCHSISLTENMAMWIFESKLESTVEKFIKPKINNFWVKNRKIVNLYIYREIKLKNIKLN